MMLWNALYDMWAFLQQIGVSFFGTILDAGKKKIHIVRNALVQDLDQHIFLARQLFHQLLKILFTQDQQRTRLKGFYAEQAGLTRAEAFHGGDAFTFEKELKADVFSVIVEPHADAALTDEICLAGYLPFLQQNGPRRDGDLPEKVLVFFPVDGMRGCLIFTRGRHGYCFMGTLLHKDTCYDKI